MKKFSQINNIFQNYFPEKYELNIFWISFFTFFGMIFFSDLQLIITENHYFLYGPYLITPDVISNIFSWLNMAQNENLSLDYPWGTVFIQKIWLQIFNLGTGYFWGRVFFSFIIYFLMYKIVRRSLNILYSIFVLHFSLICFSDFPFRTFFTNLFRGIFELPYIEATITGFPFPLISVAGFLLAYAFSTKRKNHSNKSLYVQTILFSIQAIIHPLSFILGFPIAIFTLLKSSDKISHKNWKFYFFHTLILLLGLWQTLKYLFLNTTTVSTLQSFNQMQNNHFNFFTTFYFSIYFLAPLFLTALIFLIRKISVREIALRFGHIYILMLTEMVLLFTDSLIFQGRYGEWMFSRFFIFLHLLYFIPFIYYFNISQYFIPRRNIEGHIFLRKLDYFLKLIFSSFKHLAPTMALTFLWIFSWNAQTKRKELYLKRVHPIYKKFVEDSKMIMENEVVVGGPYRNIFLLLNLKRNPLWENSFFSNKTPKEIIQRYALNFKIYSHSKEKFIDFFQTGQGNNFIFHKEFKMGLRPNHEKLKQLENIFENTDLQSGINKFHIKSIYSPRPLEHLHNLFHAKKLQNGHLYMRRKN